MTRMTTSDRATAWPPVTTDRLADALAVLAERVGERDVRAQLHALSAVLRNLGGETAGEEARRELELSLRSALADGDEQGVVATVRALARTNRAAVRPVDWSAASGA